MILSKIIGSVKIEDIERLSSAQKGKNAHNSALSSKVQDPALQNL